MIHYPFPSKENSMQDLVNDYVYSKIEPGKVEEIFEDAWSVGLRTAESFLQEHGDAPLRMQAFLKEQGFTIQVKDIDYVLGDRRYFCEYFSEKKLIKIYRKSMELWCGENGYDYEDGCNLILCHEYFHHLEWHEIGMTSRRHQVPMIKIGRFHLGKTGIPAMSEIAANAFAQECFANTWAKRDETLK